MTLQEIREKTPSDPLEAELLMMAAAVSADGKNSSDSESDEEMAPEISNEICFTSYVSVMWSSV